MITGRPSELTAAAYKMDRQSWPAWRQQVVQEKRRWPMTASKLTTVDYSQNREDALIQSGLDHTFTSFATHREGDKVINLLAPDK